MSAVVKNVRVRVIVDGKTVADALVVRGVADAITTVAQAVVGGSVSEDPVWPAGTERAWENAWSDPEQLRAARLRPLGGSRPLGW